MEIKKGRIKEIGQLEQTKSGSHLVHIGIQIGVDKTYNKYTGEEEETPEMVDYTAWHEEARKAQSIFAIGDVVEFELTHWIDRQWRRTNVVIRNLKVTEKAAGGEKAQQAAEQMEAATKDASNLPF